MPKHYVGLNPLIMFAARRRPQPSPRTAKATRSSRFGRKTVADRTGVTVWHGPWPLPVPAYGELNQRISKHNELLDELSGATRVAAQSIISVLESNRIQTYQAVVGFIASREELGKPANKLQDQIKPRLYLYAETLVGRIVASGVALEYVQNRLSIDPDNADIVAAIKEFDTSRNSYLGQLEAVILMFESLGLDSAEYQAVMLQQSSSFSIKFELLSACEVAFQVKMIMN